MAFEGWSGDFIGFFRGLEHDNSKRYFEAHRGQYEHDVRGPLLELVNELEPIFGPGRLFRLNRDIRFSADKWPYKTNVGAVAGPLYIHLDARQFFVATGAHHPDQRWLGRFRQAVASSAGEELARRLAGMRERGVHLEGNPLKTAPRGFSADHPRIELLRWREVTAGRNFGMPKWIATREARDRVLEAWDDIRPLHDWLQEHVGGEPV